MTTEQWNGLLASFYDECLTFWKNELTKQGFDEIYVSYKAKQFAKADIANLQHNPYKPQGELIPNKILFNFLMWLN